jgi:hypothetical protein
VVEMAEVVEFRKTSLTHIKRKNSETSPLLPLPPRCILRRQMTQTVKNLNREQLMALAQETYGRTLWSADDVHTLRVCWEEFERRGFGQPVIFFSPTYFDVLKVHEIESGEVREEHVQMYERTGAEIAADYRKIMRKLRGVEVAPYVEPKDLPRFEESDALDELVRIASPESQRNSLDS